MAKGQQPQQTSNEAEIPLHPVLRQQNSADKLLAAAAARRAQKEFQIEELEAWTQTINALAASPNGQIFLRSMIQFSGLFDVPSMRDTIKMVDDKMKAAFYLRWVRPYLPPDLRMELEK